MLFDLRSGKRRRVVQVVYGGLAFLFLIGFVFFGIGSEVGSNVFDSLGLTSGNGDPSDQYEDQIEAAEERLAANPDDERALLQLARYEFLAGQAELDVDEQTGIPEVTSEAQTSLGEAADAWERYLKVVDDPDIDVARQLVVAYQLLNDATGAARTQELVAEDSPSQGTYGQLAFYLYAAGKIDAADAAADRAVAEAPANQRADLRRQYEQYHRQAAQLIKAQKRAPDEATGENPFEAPLGGFPPPG